MSELTGIRRSRMIGRIAVASILAVTLIATVLALTVRNYRTAIAAHEVAADSITERSNSHAAETYLAREREAMANPNNRAFSERDHYS